MQIAAPSAEQRGLHQEQHHPTQEQDTVHVHERRERPDGKGRCRHQVAQQVAAPEAREDAGSDEDGGGAIKQTLGSEQTPWRGGAGVMDGSPMAR